MTDRKPEEFQAKAIERGLTRWAIHSCSLCNYPCGYLFNWADTEVAFDAGCNCKYTVPQARSWDDVANHYNLQSNPMVIAQYDEFWGFTPAISATSEGDNDS